jgi:hypothetical protein
VGCALCVFGSVAGWIILGTTMLMFSFIIALFPRHLPRTGSRGGPSLSAPGNPTNTKQLLHEEQPLTKAMLSDFMPNDPISSKHKEIIHIQETAAKKAEGMVFTDFFFCNGFISTAKARKLRMRQEGKAPAVNYASCHKDAW